MGEDLAGLGSDSAAGAFGRSVQRLHCPPNPYLSSWILSSRSLARLAHSLRPLHPDVVCCAVRLGLRPGSPSARAFAWPATRSLASSATTR